MLQVQLFLSRQRCTGIDLVRLSKEHALDRKSGLTQDFGREPVGSLGQEHCLPGKWLNLLYRLSAESAKFGAGVSER